MLKLVRSSLFVLSCGALSLPMWVGGVSAGPFNGVSFMDVSPLLQPFVRDSLDQGGDGLGGAAWLDFDADGDLDLYITNGKGGDNALFRNDNGSFVDIAGNAGVANGLGNSGVVAGDLDNDGYPEILVTGEGFMTQDSQTPTLLYHNMGDDTFEDVTATAGVTGAATTLSAAFGDIDNDGFLDIFISSPGHLPFNFPPGESHRNKLYRNNGDMTFEDISVSAGIDDDIGACVASFTDYDADGDMDLIVGNCNAFDAVGVVPTPFNLYENNGDMTFTDQAATAGLMEDGFWMGIALGDIDNDGDLDIYATSTGSFANGMAPHGLFSNDGDSSYTRILIPGMTDSEFGWGTTMADFDNDGNIDVFEVGALPAGGAIGPGLGNPGRLFYGDGLGDFTESAAGEVPVNLSLRYTSGLVQADFNDNGFPDLVVTTETLNAFSPGKPVLLRNQGNFNRWITVELRGTTSNRGGVGALISVLNEGNKQIREVRAGSSLNSSETPWPTFGVGLARTVHLRVKWPSGLEEIFLSRRTGRKVVLEEGTGISF